MPPSVQRTQQVYIGKTGSMSHAQSCPQFPGTQSCLALCAILVITPDRKELSTPVPLASLAHVFNTGGCLLADADVAGDCLSLAQMAEPQLSELKEGVVFPKLPKKFVFFLVGIGQCLFSFYKFFL